MANFMPKAELVVWGVQLNKAGDVIASLGKFLDEAMFLGKLSTNL